ncbi:MAG TPA: heavy metal translocating P-type ATPase [Moheibacter sp.]|nr:heavy metal translocating P-type ATPase [Moheibacter sp.]
MNTDNTSIYLPLEKVDSEHCALIVEKELSKIADIQNIQVEINNKRAKISAKNPAETLVEAVQKIRSLGYEVPTLKKRFPVLNLSCASCASSSQNILKMQTGVIDAKVNYANTAAEIEFIPNLIQTKDLKAALQSAGYDLMIDESEDAQNELEEIQQENFKKLKKRTLWAIVLSVPLLLIGMVFMEMPYANYMMWALSTPIVFVFGQQFFVGAWKQLKNRSSNMDTLVAMSTGIAYVFSVFNMIYPEFWTNKGLEAHVYFEAAGVIIAFILIGKYMEERAKSNTSSAIKKLIGLQPKVVTLVEKDGNHREIPMASIQVDDVLLVKPGDKLAVDGEVISGNSFVDESMISGEPLAVEKTIGSKVFAGTLNQKGSFQFKAEQVGGDTLLSQIIRMIQDAQGSKAPVQKLVDKIAAVFVPIVLGIALLTFVLWLILGGENGLTHGLLTMITVLVIACPCALGLATPTAIMVGVGKGAEQGILIKDAESLEKAKNIDVVVLDKTGTITEGKPTVQQLSWFNVDAVQFAPILYSIEKQSEHPLADAIVQYLDVYHSAAAAEVLLRKNKISPDEKDKHLVPPRIENLLIEGMAIENASGKGIIGTLKDEKYFVGNPTFIQEQNIPLSLDFENWMNHRENQDKTIVLFSNSSRILAAIAIADTIKPTSKAAIQKMHDLGLKVYMLTGDNAASAAAVARKVNLDDYQAGGLPEEKLNFIKKLQAEGKVVAMSGDGINDSAALAQADVGIAMGKGSDIAIESAKMTILSNDLMKIPAAIQLSKQTVSTIRQNLFWAFIYNIIGIPIAAGLLYPINGFLLNPMIAGAAMAFSSVSVVSNSLRLKWRK